MESSYIADFKTMADSTSEDVRQMMKSFGQYLQPPYLTNLYMGFLTQLKHCHTGFPINRFEHSLQTATKAFMDGRENEYVICALLHDVGEIFDPFHHDAIIAELLRHYISDKHYFMLKHHTTFQGYYYWDKLGLDKNAREQFRKHPYFDDAVEFVELYDDKAFDRDYPNMSLDDFKPMLTEFFSQRKQKGGMG